MKQEAQMEAKKRDDKHKFHKKCSQPLHLIQITSTSIQSLIHPQIRVDVGSLRFLVTALIGTGADTYTISYKLWENLGKPHL